MTHVKGSSQFPTSLARKTGALILRDAKDIERTIQALADEINMASDNIRRLLSGDGTLVESRELAARMASTCPISEPDLHPLLDDSHFGGIVMRPGPGRLADTPLLPDLGIRATDLVRLLTTAERSDRLNNHPTRINVCELCLRLGIPMAELPNEVVL